MVKRAQVRIIIMLAIVVACGFGALAYRLVDLQVLRHEELTVQAISRTVKETLLEPRRGDILDAKGNALARTEDRKVVWADPSKIENWHQFLARTLAPFLKSDPEEIESKLRLSTKPTKDGGTRTNEYIVLKEKVPVEDWAKVQAALAQLETELRKTIKPGDKQEKQALDNLKISIGAKDQQV